MTGSSSARNRHARSSVQDGPSDSATRSRTVRLAVLPAAAMAILATAVVLIVLRTQSGFADGTTWTVLAVAAVLGCGILFTGVRLGRSEAAGISQQYASLRRTVATGQADLQDVLQRLERGEPVEQVPFTHQPPSQTDPLGRLTYDVGVGLWQARTVVAQTAQLARASAPDSEERVEVFVNLARRLQSLVHRAINMLDQLENEVEDPELLKGLFHVDHLATRIRRHAENVAVLGGSVSRRQWTRPVTLTEVLRSSIAEVEHYSRVKLVPPIEGTLRGHAVADVIHLLAELVENATTFSEPQTQVLMRAQRVTAGLAVEVEDRGLGMPTQEQARINTLLAEPDRIDISKLLADGRIGLYVVSALARRHGIAVRLQSNIYGGIQAILVIPRGLMGDEPGEITAQAQYQEIADMSRPAQAAPAHHQAVQAPPSQAAAPPPTFRQPLPPARSGNAPMPVVHQHPQHTQQPQQQHPRTVEPSAPRERGSVPYVRESRDERPRLPQRHAQEHLVPELREGPAPRKTEEQEVEHDPGLMAMFRRGVSLADNEPDEPPTDSAR
ncbi:ATP-binding protein [Streptomyces sp. NBC_01288]|uniref:sensor histidine kinase n=1 Tax=Streptomyces sp. NBC_01288 TaxID=2903814 RepID=UPI002E0FEDC8|nr:ATP-binding protein [Streptomyces sp. NBC_01288]